MTLLKWIGAIVVLFWLLGFIFSVAGGLIHILLAVAVLVFLIDFFTGGRK